MTHEEIIKFLSCDDCKFATCEQCEINYTTKKAIKDLIEKRDKMIDLMAEYIVELIEYSNPGEKRETQEIIKHFRKKVEND